MIRNVPVNKMTVTAMNAEGTQVDPSRQYVAQINPESYKLSFKSCHLEDATAGMTGAHLRFNRMLPKNLNFTFLFDSTGSLGIETLNLRGVQPEIDHLLSVAYTKQGDTMRPDTLKISWGQLVYLCKLIQIDISYERFDFAGNPCRAKATCTFKQEGIAPIDDESGGGDAESAQSVEVADEDTLDKIAAKRAGAAGAMIGIAAANNLRSLRGPLSQPESGKLIIPPLP